MSIIACRKCGSKVSDQYSYCTNCQAPIKAKTKASVTQVSDTKPAAHSGFMRWLISPLEAKRGPKHKLPSHTRQGALVGAFVGFIHGILTATYAFFMIIPLIMPIVTAQIAQQSPEALRFLPTVWNFINAIMIVGAPIIGAIIGGVLGLLFVVLKKRIPGSSIVRKSMVVSLILVVISFLGVLRNLLAPTTSIVLGADFFPIQLISFALALIEYPLLGWLFGYFLARRLGHK